MGLRRNRARNTARGLSPALQKAGGDPRARTGAQGRLTDQDLDGKTIELKNGRMRIMAADGITDPTADVASLHATLCKLLQQMRGG